MWFALALLTVSSRSMIWLNLIEFKESEKIKAKVVQKLLVKGRKHFLFRTDVLKEHLKKMSGDHLLDYKNFFSDV